MIIFRICKSMSESMSKEDDLDECVRQNRKKAKEELVEFVSKRSMW